MHQNRATAAAGALRTLYSARVVAFPLCSPQRCFLSLLLLLAPLLEPPFMFLIFSLLCSTPSLFGLWLYQYPPWYISVLTSTQHTTPACSSTQNSFSRECLGTSRTPDALWRHPELFSHLGYSRASKQRFHSGGGLPVCRRSQSSEDGVKPLQLSCCPKVLTYLSTACPTQPGRSLECS